MKWQSEKIKFHKFTCSKLLAVSKTFKLINLFFKWCNYSWRQPCFSKSFHFQRRFCFAHILISFRSTSHWNTCPTAATQKAGQVGGPSGSGACTATAVQHRAKQSQQSPSQQQILGLSRITLRTTAQGVTAHRFWK